MYFETTIAGLNSQGFKASLVATYLLMPDSKEKNYICFMVFFNYVLT